MKACFLGALLAVVLASPAAANDPPIGSRLGNRLQTAPNNRHLAADAVRTGHEIARCLYNKRRAVAVAFLTARDAEANERAWRGLHGRINCKRIALMSPEVEGLFVQPPRDVLRGMIAEAALADLPVVATLAAASAHASTDYRRNWFAITGRDATVDEMAVCVAERDPAGIRTLVATRAESDEELAAVRKLGDTLGPCLPQGATLKANRQSLRAALAEALYHRAIAPIPVATQG